MDAPGLTSNPSLFCGRAIRTFAPDSKIFSIKCSKFRSQYLNCTAKIGFNCQISSKTLRSNFQIMTGFASNVDVDNCFSELSQSCEQNITGINKLKKEIENLKAELEGRVATNINQWLGDLELLKGHAVAMRENITRIGATLNPWPTSLPLNKIKIGPYARGSSRSHSFDVGKHVCHITKVKLFMGDAVDGFEISYVDDGNQVRTYGAGERVGEPHEFALENGEYIDWVMGYFKNFDRETLITKLVFQTNYKKEHSFGPGGVEHFTIPIASGKIVGFFGEYDTYINSFGVYVAPK